MLRKILFACCLLAISVTFVAGCNDAGKKPAENKPAATSTEKKDDVKKDDAKKDDAKKADAKSDKRPASPPHAPGNS